MQHLQISLWLSDSLSYKAEANEKLWIKIATNKQTQNNTTIKITLLIQKGKKHIGIL